MFILFGEMSSLIWGCGHSRVRVQIKSQNIEKEKDYKVLMKWSLILTGLISFFREIILKRDILRVSIKDD